MFNIAVRQCIVIKKEKENKINESGKKIFNGKSVADNIFYQNNHTRP